MRIANRKVLWGSLAFIVLGIVAMLWSAAPPEISWDYALPVNLAFLAALVGGMLLWASGLQTLTRSFSMGEMIIPISLVLAMKICILGSGLRELPLDVAVQIAGNAFVIYGGFLLALYALSFSGTASRHSG